MTVVNSYGIVLGESKEVHRDISELPFDKITISSSLFGAISQTPAGDMQEQLKSAYVMLADFQDLEKLSNEGVNVYKVVSAESEKLLRQLADLGYG